MCVTDRLLSQENSACSQPTCASISGWATRFVGGGAPVEVACGPTWGAGRSVVLVNLPSADVAAAAPPARVRATRAPPPQRIGRRGTVAGAFVRWAPRRAARRADPRSARRADPRAAPRVDSRAARRTACVPRRRGGGSGADRRRSIATAPPTSALRCPPSSAHRCPPTRSLNPARPLRPRWLFPAARRRPPEARGGARTAGSTAACCIAPVSVPRSQAAARRTFCSHVASPLRHPAC